MGWIDHNIKDEKLRQRIKAALADAEVFRKELGAVGGGESSAHTPSPQATGCKRLCAQPDAGVDRPDRPSFSIKPTFDESRLNKTEKLFLSDLRMRQTSVIGIQSITLKLGDDCRYTPDFWEVDGVGNFTFYEVKGFWRDDARVKIKVAARLFPWARFYAVQRLQGRWKYEQIRP